MRCGMTPTDAMHLKGDFDAFDTEASRLGVQCLLKTYRGVDASKDDSEILRFADEIYELAEHRLYGQIVGAFAQDEFWPQGKTALDDQMRAIVDKTWKRRHDVERSAFQVRFKSDATLVGVGAPTHVFLDEVAEAIGAPCAVPENAEVANAVGAAASKVTVEQQVTIYPLRGSDGVIQGYQVRGLKNAVVYEKVDEALEAARAEARAQAVEEARRRGAVGELKCDISEGRTVYSATGSWDLLKEWVVKAVVE